MRFKGDIIITDPCYICKEKELVGEYPKRDDYFIYGTDIEKYPDAVREVIDISKECSEMVKVLEQLDKALGHTDPEYRKKHSNREASLPYLTLNNSSAPDTPGFHLLSLLEQLSFPSLSP